jgi:hypothetical protein
MIDLSGGGDSPAVADQSEHLRRPSGRWPRPPAQGQHGMATGRVDLAQDKMARITGGLYPGFIWRPCSPARWGRSGRAMRSRSTKRPHRRGRVDARPRGELLPLPASALVGSPFDSYLVPGLILFAG